MSPRRPIKVILKSLSSNLSTNTITTTASSTNQSNDDISNKRSLSSLKRSKRKIEKDSISSSSMHSSPPPSSIPSEMESISSIPLSQSTINTVSTVSTFTNNPNSNMDITDSQKSYYKHDHDHSDSLNNDSLTNLSATNPKEEELLKRQEKAWQRKHQREAKLEETKMATINRILQKQTNKSKKMQKASTSNNQGQMETVQGQEINEIDRKKRGMLMGRTMNKDGKRLSFGENGIENNQGMKSFSFPIDMIFVDQLDKGRRIIITGETDDYLKELLSLSKEKMEIGTLDGMETRKNMHHELMDNKCVVCNRDRKYMHAKLKKSICSLECYKKLDIKTSSINNSNNVMKSVKN